MPIGRAVPDEIRLQAKILIVDDDPANIQVLSRSLGRVGYTRVESTTDPREAVRLVAEQRPDLIVLDLSMPELDGFGVMAKLRETGDDLPPILVVTGHQEPAVRRRCLAAGASDFLPRPYDEIEIGLRVGNLLTSWLLLGSLRQANDELEARVLERTAALEDAHHEILERLAKAAEFRDDDTGEHTRRVGDLAGALAVKLGLDAAVADLIRRAAPLHDVGKIAIPDGVLLKPGKLTVEEFEVVKTHAHIGARLLGGSAIPLLVTAAAIAHYHHENWDGSGYPTGIRGEEIPLSARITAIADVFDALTHSRPYKRAWPVEEARAELARLSGVKFDPTLLRVFLGEGSGVG
ncbi:MAG: response regulator [Myxococcales bacterium]|nr:response regulator [Myxococcales bacterium]